MSRQKAPRRWMPVIALVLLPLLWSIGIRAASAADPMLGLAITPTPTFTPSPTPTPTRPYKEKDSVCEPIIRKEADPPLARPGELVTFEITVKNVGQLGSVNGYVQDSVPDYLEVLAVQVIGEHQGLKTHWKSGQDVLVDTGILGQGAEVTIRIKTQVRQLGSTRRQLTGPQNTPIAQETLAPGLICVDNVAIFDADNCPRRTASVSPCFLPLTGASNRRWILAAGLATSVLVLSLALSIKWEAKAGGRDARC